MRKGRLGVRKAIAAAVHNDQLTVPQASFAVKQHSSVHPTKAVLNSIQHQQTVMCKGGMAYAEHMLHIYEEGMVARQHNHKGTCW